MAQYGAAITWLVIIFIIGVTGILYMMMTPLIQMFNAIGQNSGVDALTLSTIMTAITTWFPIVVIISLIMYGWRKSKNRIE